LGWSARDFLGFVWGRRRPPKSLPDLSSGQHRASSRLRRRNESNSDSPGGAQHGLGSVAEASLLPTFAQAAQRADSTNGRVAPFGSGTLPLPAQGLQCASRCTTPSEAGRLLYETPITSRS